MFDEFSLLFIFLSLVTVSTVRSTFGTVDTEERKILMRLAIRI